MSKDKKNYSDEEEVFSKDSINYKSNTEDDIEDVETEETEETEPKDLKAILKQPKDDFSENDFEDDYSTDERGRLESLYESTLKVINEKEVVTGRVVGITHRNVILNIGFKSDGSIPLSELREFPDLKIGDEIEVFIEEQENIDGQLILSYKKAKMVKSWDKIEEAHRNDTIINGLVKRRTKGGLIVDIFGIETFLPGSQIDVKPIRDFDIFVGHHIDVKIVKINHLNDNVVVSHKALIEKDIEEQKIEILKKLEKGQVLEGTIKNMTNFGVFIDLGGIDGLLHITDISWGRINHPEEVLKLDQKIRVVVIDFDNEKKRISLGMKQLEDHPWKEFDKTIDVGSKVKGKIVNVEDYGAFLEIQPGIEGLIHVSEMSWSQHLRNPQDFISIGDEIEAVVLTIDKEERKMSLGIKQLTEDPWKNENNLKKYAVGTKHKGVVRNLTNYGLFIELEEGIDGLVHISDLSWTKKIKHPSEFVKIGQDLEVIVLELDIENRRLALSHKHIEQNPWDSLETVFNKGSIHRCTIINKLDKLAVLELPYGLEGICTSKNLVKEDKSIPNVGDVLDFMVIQFSKEEKRIVLSHSNIWNNSKEEPKKPKKSKEGGSDKVILKKEELQTLGDLEVFSALKDKMDSDKAKKDKETSKAKASKKENDSIKKEEDGENKVE